MIQPYLPLSPAGHAYGCYHGNPLAPARTLFALVPSAAPLPSSVDLTQWMGYIRDQKQEGSCTGQMIAAARDLLYRKQYAYETDKSVLAANFRASASFLYKSNLIADGTLGMDAGSSIHQSFVTLNQKGACLESQEPYSDTDYSVAPTAQQTADALIYKGGAYHYLPDLQRMKQCLASGYSFGFGIDVYTSFEASWTKTGFMPMPDTRREQCLGGHAQHVVGYEDAIQCLFVQNSWSSSWGISAPGRSDGGCYWMPYAFVNAGLANDAWMIHLGPKWA